MNQTELNLYWIQSILYYCFQINNTVFFDIWGAQCGSWGYDESNNLFIADWFLNVGPFNIPQPSINTLLAYDSQTVIDFHNQYYVYPSDIIQRNSTAYFFASSSELNSIPHARLSDCDGFRAFDTTLKRVVYWNASLSQWEES